ncbi:hypothetical protein DSECCO2_583990 [anaerobic digester metagenome]
MLPFTTFDIPTTGPRLARTESPLRFDKSALESSAPTISLSFLLNVMAITALLPPATCIHHAFELYG